MDIGIERIMEAGRFAPTGGNRQPLRYTVITTPSAIETIRGMTVDALVGQADKIKKAVEKKRKSGEALPAGYELQEIYAGIWHGMAKLNSEGVDVLFYHAPALIVCHGNYRIPATPSPFRNRSTFSAARRVPSRRIPGTISELWG